MKLGSERAAGFWAPLPPSLAAVLARLESLSIRPGFALQREMALAQVLRPYLGGGAGRIVPPLAQESELAGLFLLCDFYPEDGQLTLIEQLRDVITEHIPNEERAWLDPLKHSYVDLLEPTLPHESGEAITLRSLGDGASFMLPGGDFAKDFSPGCVLLTRIIRAPGDEESGHSVWGGCGLLLSPIDAKAVVELTAEWRREMEINSGSFALGEWKEFAKRFGYMLLWAYAQLRMDALVDAVVRIRYCRPDGQPYLYSVALYDHHEYRLFVDRLADMKEFEPEKQDGQTQGASAAADLPPARAWIQRGAVGTATGITARLTLTSCQLIVECDGPERLDRIKHELAASLGFSLHFRGETLEPPVRQLSVSELMSDEPLTLVVTEEEDRTLLNQFLEKAYLEWSDQPHLALGGQTPRHAAATVSMRDKVGALIDEMAEHDPGISRMGRPAFDYNRLRSHVGLDDEAAE
jgi:hypothetical protein